MTLGARNMQLLATPQAAGRVAMELSKYMPERREGDNLAIVQTLVRGDSTEARQKEIENFVYQLSNNLIEDEDEEFMDDFGKYTKIINMFRAIDLPMSVWKDYFKKTLQEPTGRAFVDNLYEAALNTISLDILEALLWLGVDPNRIFKTWMTGERERPVQLAVDCRVKNLDMLQLFIRFDADVNLLTDEDERFPLHRAARECSVEHVRAIVEAGADIRAETYDSELIISVLDCATEADRRLDDYTDEEWKEKFGEEERPGVTTVKYLLSLFDPAIDADLIQAGLVSAAASRRRDMIPLFIEAGANVNARSTKGLTPLLAAVIRSYQDNALQTATMLMDLGADPNQGLVIRSRSGSTVFLPIHAAAARGDEKMVNLLIQRGANINARVRLKYEKDAWLVGSHFTSRKQRQSDLLMTLARCDTPLRLALFRDKRGEWEHNPKQPGAALALMRAGASLRGGEFPRAGCFDSVELLRELISRGADANEMDWTRRTALTNSLECGNFGTVRYLLEVAGTRLQGGELTKAARGGSREAVELLLEHGASLDSGQRSEESLIEAAATSKNWDLLSWIMERKGEKDNSYYSSSALCTAICAGLGSDANWERHFDMLLRRRPLGRPVCVAEATALGCAAIKGQKQIVARLLRLGRPPACVLPLGGERAIHILANGHHGTLVREYDRPFLPGGASNLRCSVLVPALALDKSSCVGMLLRSGCRPDRFALLVAVENAHIQDWQKEEMDDEEVEELVADTLAMIRRLTRMMSLEDVTYAADKLLYTPLQGAARFKRLDVVRHLVSLGVDVNVAAPPCRNPLEADDEWEPLMPRTALQAAVEHGDIEMIDLLLSAGADVNGPPARSSGATALQLAAGTGQIGTARKLMNLGADINAPGAEVHGRTALEAAAEQGRLDMVQFLLESGAKVTGEYKRVYYRSVRFARRNGYGAVERLIREWKWEREQEEGLAVADDGSTSSDMFDSSEEESEEDSEEESEEDSEEESEEDNEEASE